MSDSFLNPYSLWTGTQPGHHSSDSPHFQVGGYPNPPRYLGNIVWCLSTANKHHLEISPIWYEVFVLPPHIHRGSSDQDRALLICNKSQVTNHNERERGAKNRWIHATYPDIPCQSEWLFSITICAVDQYRLQWNLTM